MGFVGGLLGVNGGAGGTGFGGPVLAGMQTPATVQQATDQYKNVQDAIQQQKDFLAAVQAQKGLQNQSNIFNQFGDIAAGRGPNPAAAMLKQATGQISREQAATQAAQRGSSANAGLIARQAAQQAGSNAMNAAGQAATMQANQSLNALGEQAGIAGQQVGTQAGAVSGLAGSTQNEQANILNAINAQNNANISRQANVNNTNAQLAGINMQGEQNLLGGVLNKVGILGGGGKAEGGIVEKPGYADGGVAVLPAPDVGSASIPVLENAFTPKQASSQQPQQSQPASPLGRYLSSAWNHMTTDDGSASGARSGGPQQIAQPMAEGGKVPAMVSPGEVYLDRKAVKDVKKGKDPIHSGKKVPGKPKYPGNDYRNDTVPAKLEEGGIVIPNKILQSPNPHWEAMRFVHATLKKSKSRGQK